MSDTGCQQSQMSARKRSTPPCKVGAYWHSPRRREAARVRHLDLTGRGCACADCKQRAGEFTPQALANTAWAYATAGHASLLLLGAIASEATQNAATPTCPRCSCRPRPHRPAASLAGRVRDGAAHARPDGVVRRARSLGLRRRQYRRLGSCQGRLDVCCSRVQRFTKPDEHASRANTLP